MAESFYRNLFCITLLYHTCQLFITIFVVVLPMQMPILINSLILKYFP